MRVLTDKLCYGKISKRPTQTFSTYLPRKISQKCFWCNMVNTKWSLDQTAGMEVKRFDEI